MAASAQLQSLEQRVRTASDALAQLYSSVPKKTVQRIMVWALVIWLLFGVINLIWSLFSSEEPIPPAASEVIGQSRQMPGQPASVSVSIDPGAVKSWKLFGKGGPVSVAAPVAPLTDLSDAESNAKETRLQLTLNGIIESDTEKNSRAVITYQGKQQQYAIGEKLPVRGRVVLRRLLLDRVLIDNAGKVESLYLFDKRRAAARSAVRQPSAEPTVQNRSAVTSSMRQRLLENPMSITDVVRISEARENGQLIGYKVRPSKDKQQFEQLGLQTNDIVKAVNGVALDNVSNAMRVFQTLRSETEASFDITRNGESISLVVSLDDVGEDNES
ncbi:MAG: type II secretion system protein GspC [Pseudomonadota bacterium]